MNKLCPNTIKKSKLDLQLEMEALLEQRDALWRQLRDIKRQQLQLMQRAARIRLQLAQRGLTDL